jgi:hypothetical protein
MDERELIELEDEETWDFDRAIVYSPSKTARAVVPVAFGPSDFERVAAYARERGMKLSDLIRQATLDKVLTDHPEVNSDDPRLTTR